LRKNKKNEIDEMESLTNGVIMPSNPYFQFLEPNMRWVDSVPKIRGATNPQPNTRLETKNKVCITSAFNHRLIQTKKSKQGFVATPAFGRGAFSLG
jgi:hypothetical protein